MSSTSQINGHASTATKSMPMPTPTITQHKMYNIRFVLLQFHSFRHQIARRHGTLFDDYEFLSKNYLVHSFGIYFVNFAHFCWYSNIKCYQFNTYRKGVNWNGTTHTHTHNRSANFVEFNPYITAWISTQNENKYSLCISFIWRA